MALNANRASQSGISRLPLAMMSHATCAMLHIRSVSKAGVLGDGVPVHTHHWAWFICWCPLSKRHRGARRKSAIVKVRLSAAKAAVSLRRGWSVEILQVMHCLPAR